MEIIRHPLVSSTLGTQREIVSFHYGQSGSGQKVYIQSSLHADELPGMLVTHYLRQRFAALEAEGAIQGEVVVVPVANPLGLSQMVLHNHQGRFDLATGENFNRHYPAPIEAVMEQVGTKLGSDAAANVALIRAALRKALSALAPATELTSMRGTLMRLACDADVVLDLHCDCTAVLHLYTGTPLWEQAEPLARYLGAEATLVATESGDNPFDEACSQVWWQVAERVGAAIPIPMACLSVTVELRGQTDVGHALAQQDADNIIAFLQHRGVIAGTPPPMPALKRAATPLAGSEAVTTPVSGVVAFHYRPGEWVEAGVAVVDVIDPLSGDVCTLKSTTAGVLYARENRFFAQAGMRLCKIAGSTAFRTGKLLSA